MPVGDAPLRRGNVKRPKKVPARSPKPTGVFGGLRPATAPITRAQTVTRQRTRAATRRVERNVQVPVLPRLAHPTHQQRGAAQSLVAKSLHRQGVFTPAQVAALPRAQRARVHRAAGYARTATRDRYIAQALAAGGRAPSRVQLARVGRAIALHDTLRAGPRRNQTGTGGLPFASIAAGALNGLLDYGHVRSGVSELGKVAAGFGHLGEPLVKDAGILGRGALVGGIAGLRALGEAAGPYGAVALPGLGTAGWLLAGRPHGGNLKPAQQLGSGILKGLEQSAPVQLATGHPGRALKQFETHPLLTGLDFAGDIGAVGRGLGGVARAAGSTAESAGVRGALARAGSTVRPALAMSDDASAARNGLIVPRTHSKDLTRKAAEVAADKRRQPLRDANGKVVYTVDRGRKVPVLKATAEERAKFARRAGNFDASRANSRERVSRAEADVADHAVGRSTSRVGRAAAAVRPRGRTGKLEDSLRVWAVQNVIRTPATLSEDLLRHARNIRRELDHPENYPTRREFNDAQDQAAFAEKVAHNPKLLARAQRLFDAAHGHARLLNEADAAAVDRAVLHPAVAERSPLMTHAIAHMDARHVTAEEHAKLETAARAAEDQARAAVKAAPEGEKAAAQHAYKSARERRIAVSGRAPEKVRAHEALQETAARARGKAKKAQAAHASLVAKRQRLVGAQASRRGSRQHAGGEGAATAGERAKLAKLDRKIATAQAARKAAEKDFRKAKAKAGASKLPPIREGLRHPDGSFLSNDAIREHIRTGGGDPRAARDPATVAYVPHRLEVELKTSHHAQFNPGTRPNFAKGETRTGSLFRRGAASHDRGLLRDELAKKAVHITSAEQLDRAITDMGLKHPAWAKAHAGEQLSPLEQRIVDKGGMWTGKEAAEETRRLKADTGEEWVAIRAHSSGLSKAMQDRIRGEHQDPAALESLHSDLFNDRMVVDVKSRARNVVLVPAEYATQLAKHLKPAGELNKFVQLLNAPFRMAVLPQPRWLTGNLVEPYVVRLPTTGSGANVAGLAVDVLASRRLLRRLERSSDPLDRQAAKEIRAQQFGGLFVGRRGASNRRTFEDFTGKTQKALYAAHVLRNLPVLKTLGDLFLAIPKGFFHVNRYIEAGAQHAAFGHQLRQDIQEMQGSWTATLRLGEKAMEDARKGLRQTATQQRFMQAQHTLLGKYEGFGPQTRALIQGLMPFLPWTLAAARFVWWTMPVGHPVLESLLVKSDQVVQKQWDQAHQDAGALPGSLQDALITDKGGFVDVGRYTPFGFSEPIARGDLSGVASPLLPQISGVESAIRGKDPFGRDLQVKPTAGNPTGKPSMGQLLGIVLNQAAGSTIPNEANLQRVLEGGGTAYANSNVFSPKTKPGSSHMSGVRRTFDPFRPTYLKSPGGGAASAPSGGSQVQRDRVARALERAASSTTSPVQRDRIARALARAGG